MEQTIANRTAAPLGAHPDETWRGIRLRWWGVLGGLVGGVLDTALLSMLGIALTINDSDARPFVAVYFGISFAVLGYLFGSLVESQRRERRATALLQTQTEAITAARTRLAQSEKLAALGQLAATVAHEVRNPLGVMRSAAQTLRETLPEDGEGGQMSAFIIAEIDRLANVVNSLLVYARPLQPALRAVSVDELMDRALLLARADLSARRIDVRRNDARHLPPLQADSDLLSQVLLGLLANAAEAMPSGGAITLDATADAAVMTLRVSDVGPGVPADLRARVFEPFFTTRPRGTGLGLAIARQIVEAHGGHIEVGDARGGGACFAITLPVAAGDALAA
jgi:signal transduction histidine kinase